MDKSSSLPVWIYKRDGRLVPFEGDKISQSLFAAGETLGRPDAFTAHELTDGVLHFLAAELNGAIPRTSQVADTVFKVVRELGQTSIAQAYADFSRRRDQNLPSHEKTGPPGPQDRRKDGWPELPHPDVLVGVDPQTLVRRLAAGCLADYSLRSIFTRDIAAAHKEGLITLTGLDTPFEMQGGLLPRIEAGQLASTLQQIHASFGQFVVLDGPEFAEIVMGSNDHRSPNLAWWVRDFLFWLHANGFSALVNLNSASPPLWAHSLAAGPLFGSGSGISSGNTSAMRADEFLYLFCSPANEKAHVHWHLCEADFQASNEPRMDRLARFIMQGAPITISFDRPNRPISVAEGLDRKFNGLLISIGIHLPVLTRQLADRADAEKFLHKLGSLARLAITGAIQKRRFLTRYHRPRTAFVVDRARLNVVPVGLESVTRQFTGQGIRPGTPGIEFALRIIHHLYGILNEEGHRYNLEVTLDSSPPLEVWPVMGQSSQSELNFESRSLIDEAKKESDFSEADRNKSKQSLNLERIAGLTGWDDSITPREQVHAAGLMHSVTGTGTAWVQLAAAPIANKEEIIGLIRFAWKETQVCRIRFVIPQLKRTQLTATWAGDS
jgi:hypothetical protein